MSKNINKKRDAFVIGETYGMFPKNNMRFEMNYSQTGESWAFFANKSNRTLVHIKFNSDELETSYP